MNLSDVERLERYEPFACQHCGWYDTVSRIPDSVSIKWKCPDCGATFVTGEWSA